MIADLKPYGEYKESGLPWLGQVPAHWETRPAFGVYSPIQERNNGMKEKTVLSLSYGRIIIKPVEKLRGLVPESFETYQIVNPGDIVLRTTDLQNDHTSLRVGMVHNRGIITSAYLALGVKADINPEFGFQFLNVWDLSKAIYGFGSGLRQGLDFSHFKRMLVAVPPPEEQAAIVRFLDWANNRLDRTIRAKRKVIALLNEQKQAIIHRAVTRGLNDSVPMKDSGIPWLGEVPAHWEARRLKNHISKIEQGWSPQCDAQPAGDDEWGVLKVGCVNKESFSENQNKKLPHSLEPPENLEIKDGDIIVSRANTRELLGLASLVVKPRSKLILSDKLFRFRIRKEYLFARFLVLVLRAKPSRQQIEVCTNGASSSMQNIGQGVMKNLWIAFPDIMEQKELVNHIAIQSAPITKAIFRIEREIELLREYRTRLTADVVTGKFDVREFAATLPEIHPAEESERKDELNLEGEDDEGDAEETADE